MFSTKLSTVITLTIGLLSLPATAGVIFGSDGNLGGGYRWDAEHYEFNGNERSLNGGLRYSMQGGSLTTYRDLFSWDITPTAIDFGTTIEQAFNAWQSVDPVTGLSTSLNFIDDTAATVAVGNGFNTVNILGAEIDLLASTASDNGTRASSYFRTTNRDVTLTSGTTNYSSNGAIIGADININNNQGAVYTLDFFRRLLTHEIGHALGLGDVEDFNGNGFIDDNYDANNPLDTLTNSWGLLVDPLNPAASVGLTQFSPSIVTTAAIQTPGIDILMESRGLGISPDNPVTNLVPLTNDDYGMRQFLYPTLHAAKVPEPSTLILLLSAFMLLLYKRQRA
jgi:hypothetical protein